MYGTPASGYVPGSNRHARSTRWLEPAAASGFPSYCWDTGTPPSWPPFTKMLCISSTARPSMIAPPMGWRARQTAAAGSYSYTSFVANPA